MSGEYTCQDCERCSRSGFMTLLRGLAAVATIGLSEIGIAAHDFFQRTCPGCGHPMCEHTWNRALYERPLYPRVEPVFAPVQRQPTRCLHTRWSRNANGDTGCFDCGGMWDRYGHPY